MSNGNRIPDSFPTDKKFGKNPNHFQNLSEYFPKTFGNPIEIPNIFHTKMWHLCSKLRMLILQLGTHSEFPNMEFPTVYTRRYSKRLNWTLGIGLLIHILELYSKCYCFQTYIQEKKNFGMSGPFVSGIVCAGKMHLVRKCEEKRKVRKINVNKWTEYK